MSIEVDNTACNAMDNPGALKNFISNLVLPTGKHLKVRGNQVISIGMWDSIAPGEPNLNAEIDSRNSQVIFPPCKVFHNKLCAAIVQKQEKGYCLDHNNEKKTMKCCLKVKERISATLWHYEDETCY